MIKGVCMFNPIAYMRLRIAQIYNFIFRKLVYIETCVNDEKGNHTYTAIVPSNIQDEKKIAAIVNKQWRAKTGRYAWWIRLTNCCLPNVKGKWIDPFCTS